MLNSTCTSGCRPAAATSTLLCAEIHYDFWTRFWCEHSTCAASCGALKRDWLLAVGYTADREIPTRFRVYLCMDTIACKVEGHKSRCCCHALVKHTISKQSSRSRSRVVRWSHGFFNRNGGAVLAGMQTVQRRVSFPGVCRWYWWGIPSILYSYVMSTCCFGSEVYHSLGTSHICWDPSLGRRQCCSVHQYSRFLMFCYCTVTAVVLHLVSLQAAIAHRLTLEPESSSDNRMGKTPAWLNRKVIVHGYVMTRLNW